MPFRLILYPFTLDTMNSHKIISNVIAIGLQNSFTSKLTWFCDRIWDSAAMLHFLVYLAYVSFDLRKSVFKIHFMMYHALVGVTVYVKYIKRVFETYLTISLYGLDLLFKII